MLVNLSVLHHCLMACSCSSGTLVTGSIKIIRVFAGFPRKETSNDSGIARRAHVQLPSYAEV